MANVLSMNDLAVSALFGLAKLAKNSDMADLTNKYEHYRKRFREAMDVRKLTNEEMAHRMEAHAVTVSKMRGGKIALDDEWRMRIAAALRMDDSVLFGDEALPAPEPREIFQSTRKRGRKPANDNATIHVYGFAAGALIGHHAISSDVLDTLPCPPGLANVPDAYALRTRGTSMVPRYMDNEILFVNPHQKPYAGDHVVIQVEHFDGDGIQTWVKRFDIMTDAEVIVSQYNPPAQMNFQRKYVRYIHRIVPNNELYISK